MRVNVDLQLLLYLIGFENPLIYSIWSMILEKKTEEEKTIFMENMIQLFLTRAIDEIDLDQDSLE